MVNLFYRLFLFLFFLPFFNLNSCEFLEQEYQERLRLFQTGAQPIALEGLTKQLCSRLITSACLKGLEVNALEKRTIIKTVIGNVLIHQEDKTGEELYCCSAGSQEEVSFKKLRLIDHAARIAYGKYQKSETLQAWRDIGLDICTLEYQLGLHAFSLLTDSFIRWFYEAVEEHFNVPEWNFFGGSATPEWFQEACQQYAAGCYQIFTSNNFLLITSSSGRPLAVYKGSNCVRAGEADRKVAEESTSWLVAKAAGLQEVVNPVLPVRFVKGPHKGFEIDAYKPDGTLEPFAAVVEQEEEELIYKYGELGAEVVPFV